MTPSMPLDEYRRKRDFAKTAKCEVNVLQPGALRFTELAAKAEGPGDKVLSQRLKELEACGLIERSVDPGPPIKVSYELTTKGRGFGEVAASIQEWGRCLGKKSP